MSKKPAEPSAEGIARANRQRLAQEDGARALAEVEKRDIAIRQNMQRLRALREAKQADEIRNSDVLPRVASKPRKKRAAR